MAINGAEANLPPESTRWVREVEEMRRELDTLRAQVTNLIRQVNQLGGSA